MSDKTSDSDETELPGKAEGTEVFSVRKGRSGDRLHKLGVLRKRAEDVDPDDSSEERTGVGLAPEGLADEFTSASDESSWGTLVPDTASSGSKTAMVAVPADARKKAATLVGVVKKGAVATVARDATMSFSSGSAPIVDLDALSDDPRFSEDGTFDVASGEESDDSDDTIRQTPPRSPTPLGPANSPTAIEVTPRRLVSRIAEESKVELGGIYWWQNPLIKLLLIGGLAGLLIGFGVWGTKSVIQSSNDQIFLEALPADTGVKIPALVAPKPVVAPTVTARPKVRATPVVAPTVTTRSTKAKVTPKVVPKVVDRSVRVRIKSEPKQQPKQLPRRRIKKAPAKVAKSKCWRKSGQSLDECCASLTAGKGLVAFRACRKKASQE